MTQKCIKTSMQPEAVPTKSGAENVQTQAFCSFPIPHRKSGGISCEIKKAGGQDCLAILNPCFPAQSGAYAAKYYQDRPDDLERDARGAKHLPLRASAIRRRHNQEEIGPLLVKFVLSPPAEEGDISYWL